MNLEDANRIAPTLAGETATTDRVYQDWNWTYAVIPALDDDPDDYIIYVFDAEDYRIAELKTPNLANLHIYTTAVPPVWDGDTLVTSKREN